MATPTGNKLLVIGVYLSDKPNLAASISDALLSSSHWNVDCRWARIGKGIPDPALQALTKLHISVPSAKTTILNQLLQDTKLEEFEYVIIIDDDISLPEDFIDRYLSIVSSRGFALSQPARTHNSYIDHYFVAQLMGIESRQTNFVEIGPLCMIHRSAYPLILPLNEEPPMGWGLDFVWPVLLERQGLTMGIVDACPVEHSLRKPVAYYNYKDADSGMQDFLARNEHLSQEQSFNIVTSFALAPQQS
jgi:hypothetical protein